MLPAVLVQISPFPVFPLGGIHNRGARLCAILDATSGPTYERDY